MLNNHYSPNLSELDKLIVKHVPPGGNWKNIPVSVPSQRLAQIRESFKRGEGSRSTYYGRLNSQNPAYTINTYISRPGNGCFIHYEQPRLISQREAARLQSFPDWFVFTGSKGSVNTQIGNAVPPLLAYSVASQIGKNIKFVDLFSGAGGLSLGCVWAGWKPIVANDIDNSFLETYATNIHPNVIKGDIQDKNVFDSLVKAAKEEKTNKSKLFVIGGPPCQGFSTAGFRRLDDKRNQLFKDFVRYIKIVQPDGFIFENVMGLTNMDDGKVLEEIIDSFSKVAKEIKIFKLHAIDHGVPQKRKRLFIVGMNEKKTKVSEPLAVFPNSKGKTHVSVEEAMSDLPIIQAGEDGSSLKYRSAAKNPYQKLMRSLINADEFLISISKKA